MLPKNSEQQKHFLIKIMDTHGSPHLWGDGFYAQVRKFWLQHDFIYLTSYHSNA